MDDPKDIKPGETLLMRLAVFAADATRENYEIPVEAAGAHAMVHLQVSRPEFKLSIKIVDENPQTLAKTIEIKNEGEPLTDLSLRVVPPNDMEVQLQPTARHAFLPFGETLRLVASPVLYFEFESLEAGLECAAAGQSQRFPLEFKALAGKRFFGVRTATRQESSNSDWYCTNKPNTCSEVSGPEGNGPGLRLIPSNGKRGDGRGAGEPVENGVIGSNNPDGFRLANYIAKTSPFSNLEEQGDIRSNNLLLAQEATEEDIWTIPYPYFLPEPEECDPEQGECVEDCFESARILQRDWWEKENHYLNLIKGQEEWKKGSVEWNVVQWRIERAVENLEIIAKAWNKVRDDCQNRCKLDIGGLENLMEHDAKISSVLSQTEEKQKENIQQNNKQKVQNLKEQLKRNLDIIGDVLLSNNRYSASSLVKKLCPLTEFLGISFKSGVTVGGLIKIDANLCSDYAPLYIWDLNTANLANLGRLFKYIAENDPPSPIYKEVVKPLPVPINLPPDIKIPQTAKIILDINTWATAFLKAYTVSFERYQGAYEANDAEAMFLQAKAMLSFSQHAIESRRSATHKWHQWEQAIFSLIKPLLAKIDESGGWQHVFSEYRKRVGSEGLGIEFRKNLIAAEVPESEINEIEKSLRDITPEKAEEIAASWRVKSLLTQSEPPEIVELIELQQLSRHLENTAKAILGTEQSVDSSNLERIRIRPGLLEALQRRACFTRAHRRPFSAPLEGPAVNSSDFAWGWNAGDRVLFTWHQEKEKIVFASFDHRGEVLMEPQAIGTGRWPRLTTDRQRTAVAWRSGDGFTVRLHDGQKWSNEIELSGTEAALAFAPSGPLYAATSTGLWKLTVDRFEIVSKATYLQPALVIDGNGQPHVAWQRNGRIICDGMDLGQGERPSLAIDSDGTIHLAYLSKGSLVVCSRTGSTWTAPETIPAKNPSWPTLAMGTDGLRLTYIGAAEFGPDALWLLRLPDKEPVLVPSLAGNVTDAWFMIDFGLRYPLSNYRPHDVLITINDVWIKYFDNTVPQGRYLFRLNPYQIFTSSGRPVPNRVAIHSWHMNGGNYASNSNYQLIVRTAWSERFAFASSQEELLQSAWNPHLRDGLPDLVVLANALELPVERPELGRIDLVVTVAN
ncbi:MAG: hypothetical protein MN733_20755, partial [Nitrososphaera sp.]|nr:hypothetical protein [Nitrososphaera sp.]